MSRTRVFMSQTRVFMSQTRVETLFPLLEALLAVQ